MPSTLSVVVTDAIVCKLRSRLPVVSITAVMFLTALLLNGCDFFDSKLVAACETILKKRLISPPEYKRIKVSELDRLELNRAQLESYLHARQRASMSLGYPTAIDDASIEDDLKSFDNGQLKPVLYNTSIVYEAFNAYEMPVRYIADCTYLSKYGDRSKVWEHRVTVDQKTGTEWLSSNAERY
ncbi:MULTISPECIES: hypothetical protein [Rhizobium]|uniref:Uncharacterized protein n=1 Tax=Rhizobium tropici TaxID=398 RepID=A0ABR6QUX5_RHITR|nr:MULTISPECIES: hypothetical protein [Rhizobium]MBB4239907.1 hypothetical protein [Rhizobium tropici]MBB5591177.1 hypothetical protein [Rhizobium tropici]MBB6490739.1 hypothetical protein [Rhizobium tropici]TGE98829.1 hypothetical protein C9417_07320 [Rhizobium sp. SEMIA 4088]